MKFSHYVRVGAVCSVIGIQTLLSGCSQVIKGGAMIALIFTENHVIPPILKLDDANMACTSGESLTPIILATEGMGADPAKIAVFMYVSAGLCAEDKALEHELRYLRASRANMIEEAQDARISQKRWAAIAARRQQEAYRRFVARYEKEFKFKIGASCPTLKEDFDKLVYIVGLAAGVQAVVNDIAAQGIVGVPKDVAAVVERGMACLDNDEYWGVPMATRAAVWSLLPGASEGKPDPFTVMKDATRVGERKGVRLAHAIYALAAQARGDEAILRDALRTYGASSNMAVNPKFRLLDAFGSMTVQSISDRYWTEKTGTRTPEDGYTKFWDDKPSADSVGVSIDDLL